MNKFSVLDFSEVFDGLRIVPRIVLFGYMGWAAFTIDRLFYWYMGLPIAAQTVQASGFCLGACGVVTGMVGVIYRIYGNTGRPWGTLTSGSSRTTTTTEVITK